MTCPTRARPASAAPGCEGVKSLGDAGLPLLTPEGLKGIVDGLVAMFAGLAPREFRPNLFRFRSSITRSFQAMGLSEWDAYQHARDIERRADDQLCLIWDEAWAGSHE